MEHQNHNGLNIGQLNLDSFDINDELDDSEEIDIVIYSYPYKSDKTFDYEYRATITDEYLILDNVKCNDNEDCFENSVVLIENIVKVPLENAFKIISHNIDIRNNTELSAKDFVVLETENLEDIEENKKTVLKDMYQEIIENLTE